MNLQLILFSVSLLFLTSCSHSGKTKFSSFPIGATVALKSSSGEVKVLGQTPLELETQSLRRDGEINSVIFSKDGYHDQQVAMLLEKSQSNLEITAKLTSKTEDSGHKVVAGQQEKLAQLMVKAHNLIGLKRYGEAENILLSVVRDFPSVSVSYDLLGNIYYLQRDRNKALGYYERSLKMNPDNRETQRMVDRLKSSSI